jgi:ferredoxin
LDTRHRKIDTGSIGHKTQKDRHGYHWTTQDKERKTRLSFCVLYPMAHVAIVLCLVPNVTRVYLSVSCVQCYTCLSFCVLCPMLPVSLFLFLVSNVARVYRSVSCVQCFPCLSFCVLCPMLPMSIVLCLVSNVTRVYLSVSLDTRHRKIDSGNIGHKTQEDRHV